MGFAEAVRTGLRNYVRFSGRASRPEYWYFVLFCVLGSVAMSVIDLAIFGAPAPARPGQSADNGPLASLFNLATFLPLLAAGWRRMHDTGRSGLYLIYPLIVTVGILGFLSFFVGIDAMFSGDLLAIATGIGGIVLILSFGVLLLSPLLVLWWLTRPTQPGDNIYGPQPEG